jgi:hypothetical protein
VNAANQSVRGLGTEDIAGLNSAAFADDALTIFYSCNAATADDANISIATAWATATGSRVIAAKDTSGEKNPAVERGQTVYDNLYPWWADWFMPDLMQERNEKGYTAQGAMELPTIANDWQNFLYTEWVNVFPDGFGSDHLTKLEDPDKIAEPNRQPWWPLI